MTNKYAISLRKNVLVADGANTRKGNYPVEWYKGFRKFKTRREAREFKKNYKGNPVVIVNIQTQQVVR